MSTWYDSTVQFESWSSRWGRDTGLLAQDWFCTTRDYHFWNGMLTLNLGTLLPCKGNNANNTWVCKTCLSVLCICGRTFADHSYRGPTLKLQTPKLEYAFESCTVHWEQKKKKTEMKAKHLRIYNASLVVWCKTLQRNLNFSLQRLNHDSAWCSQVSECGQLKSMGRKFSKSQQVRPLNLWCFSLFWLHMFQKVLLRLRTTF